jgi:hypothetical protein
VEDPNQNKHREIQPRSSGLRRQELKGNVSRETSIYMRIGIWFLRFDNKSIPIGKIRPKFVHNHMGTNPDRLSGLTDGKASISSFVNIVRSLCVRSTANLFEKSSGIK